MRWKHLAVNRAHPQEEVTERRRTKRSQVHQLDRKVLAEATAG